MSPGHGLALESLSLGLGLVGPGLVNIHQHISPARSIQLEVSEVMEREKWKNNLVIFGLEETNDENIPKSKINEVVAAVGMNIDKVKYFGRVGGG